MTLLIWIIGAVLATVYGTILRDASVSPLRSGVKTGATLALLALALLGGGPWVLALALALGATGDYFLSRPHDQGFLPGLISFALGHGAYVALLLPVSDGPMGMGWVVFAGLVCISVMLSMHLWPVLGPLRLPVMGYVLLSLTLGALALGVPSWTICTGVLLFITSDVLLAIWLFLLPPDHTIRAPVSAAVWAFYWVGQALILVGFLALAGVGG